VFKKVNKCIYLGSEINSDGKTGNATEEYKTVLSISYKMSTVEQTDPEQCKTTIYKGYFEPVLIFNADIWILTK
jgi:hypothetical protein